MKLDFNNPIFVFYISVAGMPRSRGEEIINFYKEFFDSYENITVWIIPRHDNSTNQDTEMKLLYCNNMNRVKDVDSMKKELESISGFVYTTEKLKSKPIGFLKNLKRKLRLERFLS